MADNVQDNQGTRAQALRTNWTSIVELQRNDVEGAVRVAKALVAEGTWTIPACSVLRRLQDDATALDKLLAPLPDPQALPVDEEQQNSWLDAVKSLG